MDCTGDVGRVGTARVSQRVYLGAEGSLVSTRKFVRGKS